MNCTVEKEKSKESPSVEATARPFVRPEYKTERTGDGYRAAVVMPGVPKGAVKVSVEDGVLVLTGKRSDSVPESWRPLRLELQKPDYRLKLKLSDEIDSAAIAATIDGGVLSLDLPLREAVKPRVIAVQ